jgi:Type IV pilus assembly protein PilM
MPTSSLAVDLSSGTLRVLEGLPGGPMRCGEAAAPSDSLEGGRVRDAAALGQALRQLIARTEITTARAAIAVSDALASFRVLTFPKGITDAEIDSAVQTQLNLGSDRMSLLHHEVLARGDEVTVYAVIWDRAAVQAIAAAARLAGLEPAVVDLKSLCVARAIVDDSCIVLDMNVDPCEALLIDERVPRIWHTIKLESGGDLALAVANGLKPMLGFHRRSSGTGFGPDSPILVRSDQALPSLLTTRLDQLTGHPVNPLSQPRRVDPEVRYGAYLTCLGLAMRRSR